MHYFILAISSVNNHCAHRLAAPFSNSQNYLQNNKRSKMGYKFAIMLSALLGTALADSAGYVLPSTGSASTTQFYLGPELSSGTACGVNALPNGQSTSGKQGGGPGYLYVRLLRSSLKPHY